MFPVEKILLAVDFSEAAMDAGEIAAFFARRFGSELTILHVCPDVVITNPEAGPWRAVIERESETALNKFLLDQSKGLKVQRIVQHGDPAQRIIEQAESDGTSFIVMGTRGHAAFRRFLLGSVSAKVLHDAECPVVTAAHHNLPASLEGPSLHRILCAVDFGPLAKRTVQWAAQVACAFEARLALIHVMPMLDYDHLPGFDVDLPEALHRQVREECERLLEKAGVNAQIFIEEGDVAHAVGKFAAATNTGLVVIGRHAVTRLPGRLRQHSYSIIRESPCPVLSV